MVGLSSSPFEYNKNFIEGDVLYVDSIRFMCTVKSSGGQRLSDVTWLMTSGGGDSGGHHYTPNVGDRVMIVLGLTYPVIIGCLPRMGVSSKFTPSLGTQSISLDPGQSTPLSNGFNLNPNKPLDFSEGDQVLTSEGGGVIGLFRNGSILLKTSPTLQVFFSKIDSLLRVVSRNFERMTDSSHELYYNLYGRMYKYFGITRDLNNSKLDIYEYEEIHGDVVAGEYGGGDPFSVSRPVPTIDTRIIKKSLKNTSNYQVFLETLKTDGNLTITINQSAGTDTAVIDYRDTQLLHTVGIGGAHSSSSQTDSVITHSVTGGGATATVTISPSSIVVNFNGVSIGTFDANQINLTSHGHFLTVDSSGVHTG